MNKSTVKEVVKLQPMKKEEAAEAPLVPKYMHLIEKRGIDTLNEHKKIKIPVQYIP